MAPEVQVVVRATQSWLQNSHHIHVPFVWLEACVEWIQEEAGGAGRLSQQQINQQVLDQWLLTDLRDLAHPVLPEGISQAHKTQLSGTFCVQVDSLLDVSQPAYGQLQKWRGSDCSNDEVSAVTQFTQRPWEARPTRMLLLQVTDGVQSLEAMEYKPIPALSSALRPGVKLQLQGQMVCRLGMILLGPTNIKVLGGEVEDLVERNQQGKVLCRTLGLPEEQPETEEAPPAPQQGNQEVEDLELDDAELLAGLEGQEEVDPVQAQVQVQVQVQEGPGGDSGYRTLTDRSTQSSSRSLLSSASSRSEASAHSYRLGLARSRGGSVRGYEGGSEPDDSDITTQPEILDHNMADDDFPDEDFDDLPLDELDSEIFHESTDMQPGDSHSAMINNTITQSPDRATEAQTEQCTFNGSGSLIGSSKSRSSTQKRDYQGCIKGDKVSVCSPEPTHNLDFAANDDDDFMDDDMDCLLVAVETGGLDQDPAQQRPSRDRETSTNQTQAPGSSSRLASDSHTKPQGQSHTSNTAELDERSAKNDSSIPALTLTSPPFTYLSLLEETMSKPQPHTVEIHVKAFIVTLLGKLSSTNGLWSISATISDGTGYLDVDLSDPVLTRLLGFSVAEKAAMKRDPGRRAELDRGMRRCQEELVDMCCVMTIKLEPGGGKAVVTKANAVSEDVFQQLERRTRDGRK